MNTNTPNNIETAYLVGKLIFKGELSLKEGANRLVKLGMNESTARIAVMLYSQLRNGDEITRAHSIETADYFLNNILIENGVKALEIAIKSMLWHLDYYEKSSGIAKGRRAVIEKYSKYLKENDFEYEEQIDDPKSLLEGKVKTIQVNAVERNVQARLECIRIFGVSCAVCNMNFEKVYGDIGKNYIHVHHKIDIASVGKEYVVDPKEDLIPVCPNCHAMLHTRKPALDYKELKKLIIGAM